MLCPSDTYNRNLFNGSGSSHTNQLGDGWARGDYAANAGAGFMTYSSQAGFNAANPTGAWANRYVGGIMGTNTSQRIEDIHDGASNTILVGEIRAGVTPFDCRGVWAMSGACPSALWADGYHGDDNGPNSNAIMGDAVMSCTDVNTAVGDASGVKLAQLGMACSTANSANWQQTVRSMHSGGANIGLADGSVRFISDFVEIGTDGTAPGCLGVWDKLLLSSDNQTLDSSKY